MVNKSENLRPAQVLLSGGIDSTACIHFLLSNKFQVSAFHLSYGQPASSIERQRSEDIAQYFKIPLQTCTVVAEKNIAVGEIKGRNAFFIFSALTLAKYSPRLIAIGIHSGTNYYDCSPPFFKKISDLVADTTEGKVNLLAPFLTWTKTDIFYYFKKHKLPIELTYSCERGSLPPCGECLSCEDRKGLESVS